MVLCIFLTSTYANLGETRQQSIKHYGRIIWFNQYGVSMWNVKGFWISEWFNDKGYAEQIAYFKKSGEISQRESNAFQTVNLPPEARDQGWLEQDVIGDNPTHERIWITPDGIWRFESGSTKLGKYYYSSILVGTTKAAKELADRMATGGSNEQGQPKQPASESTDGYLPL